MLEFTCPRCNTKIAAQPSDAGSRIVCTGCQNQVKVPGVRRAAKTPDPLAMPSPVAERPRDSIQQPLAAKQQPATSQQPAASDKPPGPVAQRTTQDPTRQPNPAPTKQPAAPERAAPRPSPTREREPHSAPAPAAGEDHTIRADGLPEPDEFSAECTLCGTKIYVKPKHVGRKVKCPDCHHVFRVREPRKTVQFKPDPSGAVELKLSDVVERPDPEPVPQALLDQARGIKPGSLPADLESLANTGSSSTASSSTAPLHTPSSSSTSSVLGTTQGSVARRLLDEAEQAAPEPRRSLPSRPFWDGVLRFLRHPAAWSRAAFMAAVVSSTWTMRAHGRALAGVEGVGPWFGAVLCFVFSTILALVAGVVIAAIFLSVAQATASGEDEVHDWPTLQFTDWIGEAFFVINSVVVSGGPGLLLGTVIDSFVNSSIVSAILLGVTTFVGFPFFFFSATESNSPFAIVSKTAVESLKRSRHRWVQFYLYSFPVGLVPFALSVAVKTESFLLNTLVAALVMLALMTYARLLGRLIWSCAEDEAEQINSADQPAER